MLGFQPFRETAYERLTRTINWANEIIVKLENSDGPTEELMSEVENWTESTAFFVNFISDGEGDSKLQTLGFDPATQEPKMRLPMDLTGPHALMSMRLSLLRRWFDGLLAQISESDFRRWSILDTLDQYECAVSSVMLQERTGLDTPVLEKELYYLSHQSYVEWNKDQSKVEITEKGRVALRNTTREAQMQQHSGTNDLVFFNYASEDLDKVEKLHGLISSFEFRTWFDKTNLIPGQDWRVEIDKAIDAAGVCLIFFSSASVDKTGYVNKEIKKILDRMDEMPGNKVFMIPVRLDDCEIPRRLRDWHVLSCTGPDWHKTLIAAIRNALSFTRISGSQLACVPLLKLADGHYVRDSYPSHRTRRYRRSRAVVRAVGEKVDHVRVHAARRGEAASEQ